MLPAAARLRRPAEFAAAMRSGARAGSRVCSVHVRSGPVGASPRVGFVVSRQVGAAVVRNRVRRRLRHLMRDRLAGLPAGTDVVVRAHPAAAPLSSAALGAELDRALNRALAHKPVGV